MKRDPRERTLLESGLASPLPRFRLPPLSHSASLVVSRISGKLCWKAAGGTGRVGVDRYVHPIQSLSRGNSSPLQPSLSLCVSMNAVNKKVSSHSRIRRPAMRRNQDGGLLRKSFLEHLRIPERRPPAKKKYLLSSELAAQQRGDRYTFTVIAGRNTRFVES